MQQTIRAKTPCPFCGCSSLVVFMDHGQGLKWISVQCAACEATGPITRTEYSADIDAEWVEEALRRWEERTP